MNSNLEKIQAILEEIQVSIDWGYEIKKFILNENKYKNSIDCTTLGYPIEFNKEVKDIKMEVLGEKETFFIYK